MTIAGGDKSSSLSPCGEWLFALAFWIAGSAIIALAVGWIPAAAQSLQAPRWVVGVAGVTFLAGGFAPLAARLGPKSIVSQVVGGGIVLPLTLVANWVAFGSGPRQFSGGLTLGFVTVSQRASEMSGRIAFGIVAILLDILIATIAVRGFCGKSMTGK